MKKLFIGAIMTAVSFGAVARGHGGAHSHSHYSYHPRYRAPVYHAPAHKTIAHHIVRTAATTATRNVVNRAMKPSRPGVQAQYTNYSPQQQTAQQFGSYGVQSPPVPASMDQCSAFAGSDTALFQRCQTANGR